MPKMHNELMNYRVLGNGHPVVFLHGFLESVDMWNFISGDAFPFKCVLIDLPGHGDSELWDANETPSLNFMAAEVQKVIQFLGIDSYHVVGHSMGGYVALILKEIDANCQKVVLLNSTFKEDSVQKKRDRIRVADLALQAKNLFIQEAIPRLFYRFDKDEAVVKTLIEEAKQMDGQAIAYAALAMRERRDAFHLFADFSVDIFIVQGKYDPLISCESMQIDMVDHSNQLFVLEDVGHMSHLENPTSTLHLLRMILA
jgi:2-succinyl-6-hydroxy-2,4-cyclohexadiene-1-carboxylate synthase